MKNKKILALLLTVTVGLAGIFSTIQPDKKTQETNKDPDSIQLQPHKEQSKSSQENQRQEKRETKTNRTEELVNPSRHPSKIIAQNPNSNEVPYYLLGSVNDPEQPSMWSHSKIQAGRAWDLTTGSGDTVVAVVDTGFAVNHEEFNSKWFENSGETGFTQLGDVCWTGTSQNKKTNNCDDDSNGYKDDWRGYDFYYDDNDVSAGQVHPNGDGTQHGSLVAGTVAAAANNSKGSAGIDQQTKIMPLQVFSDNGEAYTTDLVAAIEYAVDNGADIINLSLGTNQFDKPLLDSIIYARNHNVLVVVASGNCALNDEDFCHNLPTPGRMTYPALYPESLAVGATNSSDARASFSSYGDDLDLVAPGQSISPLPTFTPSNQISAYASASGTSFASPLVAGVASLLKSQKPDLTPSQLEYILTESAEAVPSMNSDIFSNQYGWGRLNAHRATLLTLAKTQDNLLGDRDIGPREPSLNHIWRAGSGNVASDESILIGCRIFETDNCSVTVESSGNLYSFTPKRNFKGDVLRYIFIRGNSAPSGNWQVSTHNRHASSLAGNLTR